MTKYQNGILQFLEEGAWGGFDKLVPKGFFHIVVQIKSPTIFAMEKDGLNHLFRGGCGNIDWRSIRVDRDNEIYGSRGGSILRTSHCEIKVTVESTKNWCKDGCRIAVEFGTGSYDDLEGGVLGYGAKHKF